jgi:hypothetical protein
LGAGSGKNTRLRDEGENMKVLRVVIVIGTLFIIVLLTAGVFLAANVVLNAENANQNKRFDDIQEELDWYKKEKSYYEGIADECMIRLLKYRLNVTE